LIQKKELAALYLQGFQIEMILKPNAVKRWQLSKIKH